MGDVLLKMRNIDKIFPGVKALSNVDFTLRAGEIHSLMGENGAGKSTLIKVLTGVYHRDGGTITLNGKKFHQIIQKKHKNVVFLLYIKK